MTPEELRLESLLHQRVDLTGISFSEPFGFLDYSLLQTKAFCVLSDSGSISEESSILRFPAITLRSSIERPEALDTGSMIMTDLRPESSRQSASPCGVFPFVSQ